MMHRVLLRLVLLFVAVISVVFSRRTSYSCSQSVGKNEPILSLLVTSSVSSTVTCPKYYEKIDFDLNKNSGGKYIYACVIRGNATARYGVPLSNLIATVGSTNSNICPTGFTRIMQDLNAGAGGDYVYFCSQRFGSEAITDITFVESSDSCPAGYAKSPVDLNAGTGSTAIHMCLETDCKLSLNIPTTLQFRPDSKELKITQFTDSHHGENYDYDLLTAASIYRTVLQTEDPDLVALTGDQVSGYSWDGTSGWFEQVVARVLDTILSLGYPFFYTNGNHDPQADLTQREIVEVINRIGGALSFTVLSPPNVTGGSNYWLPVYSYADETKLAYSLWVLDSNGDDCEGVSGWGCIARDQVDWYVETAAQVKAKNGGSLPPALGYFHIPIDEYLMVSSVSAKNQCQGSYDEDVCCSSVNTGVFNAIKQVGDIAATFVGHDHDNDFGFNYEDVYMYYGRKSGYGGYGPPVGMQRGSRVVVIQEGVRGLAQTWVRNEDGSRDDQANCKKTGSQTICCGASTPPAFPSSRGAQSDALPIESTDHNTSSKFVKTPVEDLLLFQKQFDAVYEVQKPNKCQLYEAAFRAGMNPHKDALEHEKLVK